MGGGVDKKSHRSIGEAGGTATASLPIVQSTRVKAESALPEEMATNSHAAENSANHKLSMLFFGVITNT
jgi:hypothetical protein